MFVIYLIGNTDDRVYGIGFRINAITCFCCSSGNPRPDFCPGPTRGLGAPFTSRLVLLPISALKSECGREIYKVWEIKWASFWEIRSSGFPTRSDTNWAVQPQKMTRGLKFRTYTYIVEGSHFPCSENKGADQLRGYFLPRSWSTPLFSHMQKAGFLTTRLIY